MEKLRVQILRVPCRHGLNADTRKGPVSGTYDSEQEGHCHRVLWRLLQIQPGLSMYVVCNVFLDAVGGATTRCSSDLSTQRSQWKYGYLLSFSVNKIPITYLLT
jgi:hypothetical protein